MPARSGFASCLVRNIIQFHKCAFANLSDRLYRISTENPGNYCIRVPREKGKWNRGARNGTRGDPCCKPVQQTARLQQKSRDFPGNSRLQSIQCIVRTFNQALCFEPPSTMSTTFMDTTRSDA